GMVGLIEDVKRVVQPGFKNEGDVIALLGETHDLSLGEYTVVGTEHGSDATRGARPTAMEGSDDLRVPTLDLNRELAVQSACLRSAETGLLKSAHDCSEGGLAVALAECCFSSLNREAIGAEISLKPEVRSPGSTENSPFSSLEPHASSLSLFSESPSRIIIS